MNNQHNFFKQADEEINYFSQDELKYLFSIGKEIEDWEQRVKYEASIRFLMRDIHGKEIVNEVLQEYNRRMI